MKLKLGLLFLFGATLFAAFFAWNSGKPGLPVINLQPSDPIYPTIPAGEKPLKLAITSVYAPRRARDSYQGLIQYLSKELGRPVELIQRTTYAEISELLEQGEIDLALSCSLPYVLGKKKYGAQLLAAPQINGETSYRSYIIVPRSLNIDTLGGLWGKTIALSDPDSFSGSLYLLYRLFQMGETSHSFFDKYFYSNNHEYSIRAVVDRLADAAPVNSIVFHTLSGENPRLNDFFTIIDRSPPVGNPPAITGPHLPESLYLELQQVFLTMHQNFEGQQVLSQMGFDRFLPGNDDDYDYLRRILTEMNLLEGSEQ